ncbi:MAG TPA: quinate 5-dehydrogenase [Armatimonadota bacterium]|nr:quinate 5-dehydrogenase [Armatimonadota bacterium]
MRKVVSVSLGSSKGDKTAVATLLGEEFEISRIGTNGDMAKFGQLVRELDGNVDAIGLGGIDLYLYAAGGKRYTIRDAKKLAANAKVTPIVDGSGIKNTLERETVEWLHNRKILDFSDKKVLVVCGVDRFGIAQAISRVAKSVIFGDLMFNVGVPIPIRSYRGLNIVARTLLPIVCILPFKWYYPTGEKQEKVTPKHEKHFRWADVIAGDYKIIGRFMPPPESGAMAGKAVITNTLTQEDVGNLKARGVKTLITSTKEFDGRTFATNVLEGIVITLAGKRPEEMKPEDYLDTLRKMDWEPTVRNLTE